MEKGITKIPESAIRFLKLYINGDASGLLGKNWEGFYFKDELFCVPEWRRVFTPHEIRSMFWKCQLTSSLEREIKILKQEIDGQNIEIENLESKANFYSVLAQTQSDILGVKARSNRTVGIRPIEATCSILPNDSFLTENEQSIPLDQLDLSVQPLDKLMVMH